MGVFFLRYIKGLWRVAEGLIYTAFTDENLYDEMSEKTRHLSSRVIAVDYGTTNPCVFLDTYDDGQTIWVEREYRWDSRSEEAQRSGLPRKRTSSMRTIWQSLWAAGQKTNVRSLWIRRQLRSFRNCVRGGGW